MSPEVQVTGVRELASAFRQIDKDLPKELRVAFREIAVRVIGIAQQKMPYRSGEAAGSLKPRATQRGAGIAFPQGGTPWRGVRADYYPWLDFGGTTGKGHVANGHNGYGGSIVRPIVIGGRYVYPAIAESRDDIADQVYRAVETVAEHAKFETREGL